jgi:hypothetical protein
MKTDAYIHFDTLSLKPNAAILGVGLGLFNLEQRDVTPEVTYITTTLVNQEQWGRECAYESLEWWRSDAPYNDPLAESGRMLLNEAMATILTVLESRTKDPRIWFASAMCEGGIMQSLMDLFEVTDVPWRYWDVNCVRTFLGMTSRYTGKQLVQPYGVSPRDHIFMRVDLIRDLHVIQAGEAQRKAV